MTVPPFDTPPGAGHVPARPARPVRVWDVVVTIVLLVLLAVLAMFTSGFFLVMASDPCGASVNCDSGLITMGVIAAVGLPWVVLIAAIAGSITLLVLRRLAFWVPLAAAPVVIGAWFLGAAIADAGVPT